MKGFISMLDANQTRMVRLSVEINATNLDETRQNESCKV